MKNESQQSTKVCSNCGKPDELHSGIKGNIGYTDLCLKCVGVVGSAIFSRQFDRQSQRRTYAKDIVQSTERDYAKIYGEAAARKRGWTDEDLHRFG
jgi:hypothetical protein